MKSAQRKMRQLAEVGLTSVLIVPAGVLRRQLADDWPANKLHQDRRNDKGLRFEEGLRFDGIGERP